MVTRARTLAAVRRAYAERHARRRRRAFTRAASAAGLALALAGTVQPVRAWFMSGLAAVGVTSPPVESEVVLQPATAVRRGSVVAFTPGDGPFDLRVEQSQRVGSVTIEVRDVERASAQILNGGEETMLVLPSGLAIENRAESEASYLVVVPATVGEFRLLVDGRRVAVMRTDRRSPPWSRSFDLSSPAE